VNRHPFWWLAGALGAAAALIAVAAVLATSGDGASDAPHAARASDPAPTPDRVIGVAPTVRPAFTLGIGPPVGRPIPRGYLGLSIEFQAIRAYTGTDPSHINPVLLQLIRNLSPGQAPVIRIGGDSTDASWVPTPGIKPPPQVTYALTPSWFATTDALVRQLGARLTAGINLGANQPALAAAEARRDAQVFGSSLAAFEIGNEPNVYNVIAAYHAPSGAPVLTRPRSFGYPDYLSEFHATAARLPAQPLAGPALAAGPTPTPGSWAQTLPGFLKANPRVRYLTIHRYPLRNCYVGPGSQQYPTVSNLLSSYASTALAKGIAAYVHMAHAAGRELRIDELNSVACRGKHAVSDTSAAGLWVVDALFALARQGVDGVNMHTLPRSAYELFRFSRSDDQWRAFVAPVYYGLYLFARAAPPGARLLRVEGGHQAPGLSVWATRAADGQVRAVIVNESQSRRQRVGLRAPAGWRGPATLLRMRAPSVRSEGHVTIGGVSFGSETQTGVLPQGISQRLNPRAGAFGVSVPAGSAALVTFGRG
jgi:hypothetical protein